MNGSVWALFAVLCIGLAMPVSAQSLPSVVTDLLDATKAECAFFENGTTDIPDDALHQIDLTGNGQADDWVFDYQKVQCSSAASLYCGTGGCSIDLIVGDTVTNKLAKGWSTVDFGATHTVLLHVHGANCGGTNLNACVEALVWDAEEQKFFSLAPEPN